MGSNAEELSAQGGGLGDPDREVTLKCEGDPRTLRAKLSTLVANSKYFEGSASFETTEFCFDPKIVSFTALQILVPYMHSKILLKPVSMCFIEELFVAADYLQMDAALKILMDFLHAPMELSNEIGIGTLRTYLRLFEIVERYAKAANYQYKKMKMKCLIRTTNSFGTSDLDLSIKTMLSLNFEKIMFDPDILNLSPASLREILARDELDTTEENVLRTVKMWINHDFVNRKQCFGLLLQCVRYNPDLKMEFMTEELSCTCCCPSLFGCKCLPSNRFLIDLFVKRNGWKIHTKVNSRSRIRLRK